MGLFNKNGKENGVDIDVANYQNQSGDNMAMHSQADKTVVRNGYSGSPVASSYGIKDAIQLMRELPNVNSDIVITVVRKTLESTKIQVSEIIADAQQREHTIETRSNQLTSKIEQLESEISKLNKEISQLTADLEETAQVRELLVRSMEQDRPAQMQKPAAVQSTNQASQNKAGSNAAIPLPEKA